MVTKKVETRGGARPGSGPKQMPSTQVDERDPDVVLAMVMRGEVTLSPTQLKATMALARMAHAKEVAVLRTRTGKKVATEESAKQIASSGKFATRNAPLRVVNAKNS